jgi:hypothetical protein
MKKAVLAIILITNTICAKAQTQIVDSIKLNRAIQNSEYIFEGKVIDQCSYSANGSIYTASYIQLSRAFKGNLQSGIVAVITEGGRYKNERLLVSHTANFYKGFTGIVFCKTSPYWYDNVVCKSLTNNANVSVVSNRNAIIEYSADGYNSIAHGLSCKFNTLDAVYDYIQNKTKTAITNFNQPQITQLYNDEANKLKYLTELEINTNVSTVTKNSGATNDIKYIFANTKVTGDTTKYFECDVQINANNASTYFDQGAFRIKFNPIAFGTNIATKVIATLGANFAAVTYPTITKINKQTNVVSVWVKSAVYGKTRTNITTTYQTLVHLKIPFIECNSLPTFKLDTFYNVLNYSTFASFATNPTIQTYTSVDLLDTTSGLNCQPIVTKVYSLKDALKTTRKVAGGIGEEIQLEGKHFGDSWGTLYMQSADDYGTWLPLDEYDIKDWNDTTIRFVLPSIVLDANYSTPGSGNVGVRNIWKGVVDTNIITLSKKLTVDYSISNWVDFSSSFYKAPVILASNNNVDSSFTYYLHPNVTPQMKACISAAINKWRCFTGVNFKLATITKPNGIANDNVNMIKVIYDSDSSTIMAAYLRDTICNTLLVAPPFAVSNIDK